MNETYRDESEEPVEGLPDDPGRPASQADQLLISYLDGELDERASAELESRLATDETLRTRLHEFQQTWDLLDGVQPAPQNDAFVRTTLEIVVGQARNRSRRRNRILAQVLAAALVFVLPLGGAFAWMRHWQERPYQEFVANLPFWENVDMYDQVDSMRLVEEMHAAGWFSGGDADER